MIRNSKNTILLAKHFLSNDLAKIGDEILKRNDCEVKLNKSNEIVFLIEKGGSAYELAVTEAIEKQLRYLNDLAKSSLSIKEFDTVLSTPCYFTQQESDLLKFKNKKFLF